MKTAYFNRFSLELPDECVEDCSRPGQPADEPVAFWESRLYWAGKFSDLPADAVRAELKEYGAWDQDALADDEANRKRLIWIAACNIREEMQSANP